MLNKKLFVPFFVLASCAVAFAQQAPTQQVTLESGLQVTIGTCTRSSQSITCPVEVANNTRKSVMWDSSTYGDSVRVIDVDGTAYIAPVSFGSAASKMTPAGQRNKGSFVISNITSSAAVFPLVQYGSLEFRGVKVGGGKPNTTVTSEQPVGKLISMTSSDKILTVKLIGCEKWADGFKCDMFFYGNQKGEDIIGFQDRPIASTDDGRALKATNFMVMDVDNLNGSHEIKWLPQTDVTARVYFETKTLPKKVMALQFFAGIHYSYSPFVFKNIVVK
jgi:hypothetical protein